MKHKPKTFMVGISIGLTTSPRVVLQGRGLAAYGWDEEQLLINGLIRANCSWEGWTYWLTDKGREYVANLSPREIYECKYRLHRIGYHVDEFASDSSF